MEISSEALIAVGLVALCLFLILLAILIAHFILKWKAGENRSKFKYKRVSKRFNRSSKRGQFFVPKLSSMFPTSPVPIQFNESVAPSSSEQHKNWEHLMVGDQATPVSTPRLKKTSLGRIQEVFSARSMDGPNKEEIDLMNHRRNRRVASDSDLLLATYDRRVSLTPRVKKTRSLSDGREKSADKWGKLKRALRRAGLRSLSEISGQIEYAIFYDSANEKLFIEVVQVFDINEVTPDLFLGHCDVFDIEKVSLDIQKPCLIRENDQSISFSNLSELGLCVQVSLFPKKKTIGATELKPGGSNLVFNERFAVEDRSIEEIHGCTVRFQVLLRYGKHRQHPIIMGETIAPLKNIKADVITPFTEYLKLPIDEEEFESSLSEDSSLGHLTVSVRYQLLRQVLTVRIVNATDLPRSIGGLPNSSVKVYLFLNESLKFKRTTDIIRKTTKPNFKQSFDFDIAQNKLPEVGILLQVRMHAIYKTVLGYVHIGPAAEGTGREHWSEVLSFSDYNSESIFDICHRKPNTICL